MPFGCHHEVPGLLFGEDPELLRLHFGPFNGIERVVADQAFLDRLGKGTMQGHMHQLDRTGTLPFHLQPQIELADMRGSNCLQTHLAKNRQDVLFGVAPIVAGRVWPAGEFLTREPALHVSFQGELRAFKGQAVFDLVKGLFDPLAAFMLGLGVLGDAPAREADLSTPEAIFAVIDRAFVVSASTSHSDSSFL